MQSERRERLIRWLIALALVSLTVAVYAPVRSFDFVTYDDGWFVSENPAIAGGLSVQGLRWAFQNAYLGTGGPLTWISHMADVQAHGLSAPGHHVTSLLLHAANTVLLFCVLRRMTGRLAPSAMVAALFAVHPLHVESVAWIAQRKDVLSTLFWLLAIAAYIGYTDQPTPARYGLVAILHVMGLLSKPMVATLPFTLLLLDGWPLGRWPVCRFDRNRAGRLILEKIPLGILSLLALWAALRAQRQAGAITDLQALPVTVRAANAVVTYVSYIGKFLWPSGLTVHYPYRLDLDISTVFGCLFFLGAATLAALALRRRVPAVFVGWAWYLGTLVPTIGIVQVGGHSMADRFTYVPAIGLFVLVVWGALAVTERLRVPRAVTAAAAALSYWWRSSYLRVHKS